MRQPFSWRLALPVILVCASGAHCGRPFGSFTPQYGPPAPRLLSDAPTVGQVIEVVNRNTAAVLAYRTDNARISVPDLPTLHATIAVEQPRRLRLRAGTPLAGTEVDLGSNDELFWVWLRQSQPPAVYFARHDQFASSPAREQVPIDPQWLMEALGLVHLDPRGSHSAPIARPGGRLEIRSTQGSPSGESIKLTVVDGVRGWVVEQHYYGPAGDHLASAFSRGHRYDPAAGVSLPTHVDLQLPKAQLSLSIELGAFQINPPRGETSALWAKPQFAGYSQVDLGAPRGQGLPTAAPSAAPRTASPPALYHLPPPVTETWRGPGSRRLY